MSVTFRQIAVSGSAAVAILGGAAAITAASAPAASAAEMQTVAERTITAPVNPPDGRTLRITGLRGYGHTATDNHVAAIAAFKTDTPTTPPDANDGVGTGLTPDGGVGAAITGPVNGTQAGYNQQQITTQSSGGSIAIGIVSTLVLGIIVFFKVKHGHLKVGETVLVGLLGVFLGGTFIGAMGSQVTNSLVGSVGSMLGGLG